MSGEIEEDLSRRKAEQQDDLEEDVIALALARATLEVTSDAILVTDLFGTILERSPRLTQIWNLSPDLYSTSQYSKLINHFASQVTNPEQFFKRTAEICDSSEEALDELSLNDGRSIEQYTRAQFSEGIPIGRVWSFRDISDRKRAEELRFRLAAVIESSDDAVVTKTLHGVVTTWNRGAESLFGYAADEIVGKSIHLVIPPERSHEEDEILNRLQAGERVKHYETERIRKNGERFPVSVSVSPIKDASGKIIGAAKIARDISDRARAESLQLRLAAMVESSDDAIISKTLEGIIQTWNTGAEEIFGYKADEVIGRPITILIPHERLNEEVTIIERLTRGEKIQHFETQRIRKNGELIDISLSISPIRDGKGRVIGASKIARDISAQVQYERALRTSEERLRAVVEATPECVKIVGPDGVLEFMNRAGLETLECDSEKRILGGSFYDFIAPEHRDAWIERHLQVCAGERLTWEFQVVTVHGNRRWMQTHAVPLERAEGKLAQLSVTKDITTEKAAEAEREELLRNERAARADAENASRLKDEFLATLSHELRTPLNAILGWSQLLAAGKISKADLDQGLDVIQRNARAQTQLIEDLLDMSRIISGMVRLDVQRTDLTAVVDAAISSVRPAAEAKAIQLRRILDPNAAPVSGDPTRLQQVIWNLLSNAIKFTPKGGKVDVLLERVDSHLEITVHDNGMGIKAEFLPIIFERFRQADSSTTRQHGGLGLGLSIVKNLVELHGGSVRAKSGGEGKGSTFIVALPIAPLVSDSRGEHPRTPKAAELDWDCLSLKGMKALIVDDEPDARDLILQLLTQCEAHVETAASADDGLALLRKTRPDILISDIGMPHKDGYQFIREVRRLPANEGGDTPAIAITAFARSEDRTRALLAGFQIHIAKPIEPQELIATVSSLLRRGAKS